MTSSHLCFRDIFVCIQIPFVPLQPNILKYSAVVVSLGFMYFILSKHLNKVILSFWSLLFYVKHSCLERYLHIWASTKPKLVYHSEMYWWQVYFKLSSKIFCKKAYNLIPFCVQYWSILWLDVYKSGQDIFQGNLIITYLYVLCNKDVKQNWNIIYHAPTWNRIVVVHEYFTQINN